VAHALEAYFGRGDASLSDRFVFAVISEAIANGPALMKDLHNVELRAKIMYAATCALNGMVFYGRAGGDWGVHNFGHQFSLLYDIPHGATLAMGFPAWMKLQKDKIPGRISHMGKNLWGCDTADQTIKAFEEFFSTLGSPIRLSQVGLHQVQKQEILEVALKNKVSGDHHKLGQEEYDRLYDLML
jgi:alcohol dehydrogenase YqhD (iron-dependent ADH family)